MKRGSALLIVLGMIAFMVISAVAFSAYMRFARLPSSYLRRASSSRLLAKAALAEAIDQLDIALGNDPFPYSLGHEFTEGAVYPDEGWDSPRASVKNRPVRRERRNYWRNNCFIGTNRLVLANNTVSTLTLEGLAYLPPALINEARFYSRHSAGATWHNFGFDVGRYAFFAVDVSDHFDVNRVFADSARNSSDRGRITLAHVFENSDHSGVGSPSPSDWDDFVGEKAFGSRSKLNDIKKGVSGAYRNASDSVPFTSLADLNLAINQKGWSPNMSPFCQYILNQEDFVVSVGATEPKAEMSRNMVFVTDSYTPNTNNANSAKYDLCRSQPFRRMLHGPTEQMSYDEQMDGSMSTDILTLLNTKITELDTVSLYDYLDENDIPTSLALPSVERVPMICGLEPSISFQLEPQMTKEWDDTKAPKEEEVGTTKPQVRSYKLKVVNPVGTVRVLCLYPFLRNAEADQGTSFAVDVAVRLGFTVGNGPGARVGQSAFVVSNKDDFESKKKDGVKIENGVIKMHATAQGTVRCSGVKDVSSAFSTLVATLNASDLESLTDKAVFTVTHQFKAIPGDKETKTPPHWEEQGELADASVGAELDLHPLDADGNPKSSGGFTKDYLMGQKADCVVKPFASVFARVYSKQSNKYVDLVPAHCENDSGYNSIENVEFSDSIKSVSGTSHPLLTLAGSKEIKFSEKDFAAGGQIQEDLSPKDDGGSFICPDPRWNFAPENFYVRGGPLPDANTFVQNCNLGEDGRDNDIFMACSNQGYMQSPSEFAFLPRTTTVRLPCADQLGNAVPSFNDLSRLESEGAAPYGTGINNGLAHGHLMWKTYRTHAGKGADDDRLYSFGITSGGSGFRVNPYTTSKGVMLAALANTPVSWWAASTNYTANARGKSGLANYQYKDAKQFNEKYAFCGLNSAPDENVIEWDDLKQVAANFIANFRSPNYDSWEDAYQALWNSNVTKDQYLDYLCGVKLNGNDTTDLHEVDRKMLYGFWRDSFAARQQLFLVFVRAEPMMMGGSGAGQTPPQLGARAVALVWRDPTPSPEDVGNNQPRPHRTRVLFYRQFD